LDSPYQNSWKLVSFSNSYAITHKKLAVLVLSLCRNYKEDPHWFVMGFMLERGLIQMEYIGLEGLLVVEISLAFRGLWWQCRV